MAATLLVIHILLAICLIIVILVQRTSADGGGLMGGSSSMGGLMSVRGTANLLTRITSVLATGFIITSILLTIVAGSHSKRAASITDQIAPAPVEQKAPDAPQQSVPAVPISK